MENQRTRNWFDSAKPFIAVVSMQFGYAGMDILSQAALNKGMSIYVFVMYRNAVAFIVMVPFAVYFDRKVRPKMTCSIFFQIVVMSVLTSVIGQNLYFLGMKFTTAAFSSALTNILPAITFIMAFILRLEKVKIKSMRSQAKVVGTLASVTGAMVMTLIKGPILFGSPKGISHDQHKKATNTLQTVTGSVMITMACFSWACSVNLQAITLKSYPASLSLTSWNCFLATFEGAILALIIERDDPSVWSIKWNMSLLSAVYTGIVVSGVCYYLQGVVVKTRGPVFVTSFGPLGMVIVAIMGYFIMAEQMFVGRVVGAVVICFGLYLVVWGKSIDYSPPKPNFQEHVLKCTKTIDGGDFKKERCTDHEVITVQ